MGRKNARNILVEWLICCKAAASVFQIYFRILIDEGPRRHFFCWRGSWRVFGPIHLQFPSSFLLADMTTFLIMCCIEAWQDQHCMRDRKDVCCIRDRKNEMMWWTIQVIGNGRQCGLPTWLFRHVSSKTNEPFNLCSSNSQERSCRGGRFWVGRTWEANTTRVLAYLKLRANTAYRIN